jgi:hypothetical protein
LEASDTPPHDPATPWLSVIIPCWNAAATIEMSVGSVLAERTESLECVVVDDASTDDTPAILTAMAARDPRLVVVLCEDNGGASAARNRALEIARGTWLTFLDADDRILPGGIAALMRPTRSDDVRAVVGQRISTDGERTWMPPSYDVPDIREPGRKSLATHPGLLYYVGAPGKAYHRSCTTGLTFEGRVMGDQPWTVRALLRAGDGIEVVGDVVYEWRRPHPDHYVPTITAARQRSAALAAKAVGMALPAYTIVSAEMRRLLDPPTAARLSAAYFDRLLVADLADQLLAALKRADPDIGLVFTALSSLFAAMPREIITQSRALGTRILAPPLRYWTNLSAADRQAYLDILAARLTAQPALLGEVGGGRAGRAALRLFAAADTRPTRALVGAAFQRSSKAQVKPASIAAEG